MLQLRNLIPTTLPIRTVFQLLILFWAALSASALAEFDDATQWQNLGGDPGFNGNVRAMVLDDEGKLFCGGDFTSVDGVSASRVAMWDGVTWTPLGDGINGTVHSLALSDEGELYAGGQFSQAGRIAARSIAKWDGTNWAALGTGVGGIVYSLTTIGDDTYAGGIFESAGGIKVNNIASWDGGTWSALGTGANGAVYALTSNGSTLIAGGGFSRVNGVGANHLAQWTGREWSSVGGSRINNQVFALKQAGGNLYVGGEFTLAGGLTKGRKIARWDGTAWNALGDGLGFNIYAIEEYEGKVFVGMTNSLAQWNGSAWIPLGSGTDGLVRTLVNDRLNLYVGGFFTTAGGKTSTYAAEAITAFEPNLSVELPQGTRLAAEDEIDYGSTAIDSIDGRSVFTVRNLGNLDLSITNITLTGGDDLDFFDLDTGDALDPLPAEGTTTFTVTFLPTEAGEKTVTLEVESNDPDTPTFTLTIKGTGADAGDMFFAAMEDAGLMDFDTLPEEIVFNDGVANILKYGFNMDLTGPDNATLQADGTSGLPRYSLIEDGGDHYFRFEFLRRKGSGLIYTPLKSPDLTGPFLEPLATPRIEDIDLQWERVIIDEPVDLFTQPTCFGRVKVELPEVDLP